ncbi:thioesterase family protein [Microbacterium sp. 179-B 1A2 NHS]|uniref:thioesterase family protein n=1 Tax=Microbacterium sp. 179-B 1A2 NHS TaxID=3142383 RepID=UPI00399EF072
MPSYFVRADATRFVPTSLTGGAWNVAEQHVAPPIGLVAHAIERDHIARSPQPMQLSRLSVDILGTIPIDEVEVTCRVLRPGRSIELVEGTLSSNGRPALVARAWLMHTRDTAALAGTGHAPMPAPEELRPWDPTTAWPGEFIATVGEIRRRELGSGRAQSWIDPVVPLLADEEVSTTSRLASLVDIANGVAARVDPREVAFPNLDLTLHLLRAPATGWIGFDTTVTFGGSGLGLTHTVLHDADGPVGTVVQSLTVRPHGR